MKTNTIAYLATCEDNQPMVRPVSPIVEDDMSIWITTNSSSRKVKQIHQNNKVSLAFLSYPGGERAATIIGTADISENLAEKKRVWELAVFDLSDNFPNGPESVEFCLIKINITSVEWREDWQSQKEIFQPF
jgi:general stress protein 26